MNGITYNYFVCFSDDGKYALSENLSSADASANLQESAQQEETANLTGTGTEFRPFEWENVRPTLTILWQGLLAIFVAIGVIIAVVAIVNRVISFCSEQAKKRREEKLSASATDGSESGTLPDKNEDGGNAPRKK